MRLSILSATLPAASAAALLAASGLAQQLTGPQWSVEPPAGLAAVGESLASAGDVNGDGFEDLSGNGVGTSSGSVELYLGSPNGPAATPDWSWKSGFSKNATGAAMAGADVNDGGIAGPVEPARTSRSAGPASASTSESATVVRAATAPRASALLLPVIAGALQLAVDRGLGPLVVEAADARLQDLDGLLCGGPATDPVNAHGSA